jgi:hypothetical protein
VDEVKTAGKVRGGRVGDAAPLSQGFHHVEQSSVGADGTCMRAALASIFGLRERDVPDFQGDDQPADVNAWLNPLGWSYRRAPVDGRKPDGWSTIEGVSPRGGLHACVAKDGELAWDPHPAALGDGQGLVEPRWYGLLERVGTDGAGRDANTYKTASMRGPSVVSQTGAGKRITSVDGTRWAVSVNKKRALPDSKYDVVETWTLKRRDTGGKVVTVATDRCKEYAEKFVNAQG